MENAREYESYEEKSKEFILDLLPIGCEPWKAPSAPKSLRGGGQGPRL